MISIWKKIRFFAICVQNLQQKFHDPERFGLMPREWSAPHTLGSAKRKKKRRIPSEVAGKMGPASSAPLVMVTRFNALKLLPLACGAGHMLKHMHLLNIYRLRALCVKQSPSLKCNCGGVFDMKT